LLNELFGRVKRVARGGYTSNQPGLQKYTGHS
jgi:hypothetical protein